MGYLDNSGDILVDAVLTDVGREFLARNDGSFEIVRFAFGDDEIDYSLFNPNIGSLQQDINIINTPIFEASVNERIALKSRLISISNPTLKYVPTLTVSNSTISLGEKTDSQVGKVLEFKQSTQSGRTVPAEVRDSSFVVQMNHDLLYVSTATPINISPDNVAQYVLQSTAIQANQGSQINFKVAVQALTNDIWTTQGSGTIGSRTITAKVRCIGAVSGLATEATITITEEFSR
jgi:hypothetical protein